MGIDASLMAMQEIEIGKRGPRVREAVAEHSEAVADYFAARWALGLEVRKAFLEALAAQEAIALEREGLDLARRLEGLTARAAGAGASTKVELLEARVEVSKAELAIRDRERDLAAWKRRLEALLDLPAGTVAGLRGPFGPGVLLPPLPELRALSEKRNPEVRRAAARLERARIAVEREEARPIPDVTVSAGAMHTEGMEGGGSRTSLAFGASLPIPLLDANRAGVAAAKSRVRMLEEEAHAVLRGIHGELERAAEDHEKARADALAWRRGILPDLEEAARLARRGYEGGKFSLPDALERERKLVDARLAVVRMDLEREKALAEIEAAAGGPVGGK